MNILAIFAGGARRYRGSEPNLVSKPLWYLGELPLVKHFFARCITEASRKRFDQIVLMVERDEVEQFQRIFELEDRQSNLSFSVTDRGSSTLNKAAAAIADLDVDRGSRLTFVYPDIFHATAIDSVIATPLSGDSLVISVRPLLSRFPRIFVGPFDSGVRAVSRPGDGIEANQALLFGGHLSSSVSVFEILFNKHLLWEETSSLEVDVLAWLASERRLKYVAPRGTWVKVDSERDAEMLSGALLVGS